MIRVFLIALFPNTTFPFIGESHGICAISGYLQAKYPDSVEVYLLDQQINANDEIVHAIDHYHPAIIGLSVKMQTLTQFQQLYRLFEKRIFPIYKPIIVLGNSTAHFNGEHILSEGYNVLISVGEGEVCFGDLILYIQGKMPFQNIRNILYLKNGFCVHSHKEFLNKVEIPIADRRCSKLYYDRGGEVYIEGSRGCAYCGCSICECRDFLGSCQLSLRWRERPVKSIIKELRMIKELGIEKVTFADEDFLGTDTFGLEHALDLSEEILKEDIGIQYRINARVHSIYNKVDNREMRSKRIEVLKSLQSSGLAKIFLGFESGSFSQLRRYNKGFLLSEFLSAKEIIEQLSIDYELGYILLDPLATLDEIKDSLAFIKNSKCISHISSIYKELRIQSGNHMYLNKIRSNEAEHSIKILDELNFEEQIYPVIQYMDPMVNLLKQHMDFYEQQTYKLYYIMRILTQYTEKKGHDPSMYSIYQTMFELKENDYNLLLELIDKIECGMDSHDLLSVVDYYNQKRLEMYNNLINRLKSFDSVNYQYLQMMYEDTFRNHNK